MSSTAPAISLPPVADLPGWLQAELRSNHAGEVGAVYIYRGILTVSRDQQLRDFAAEHLQQEEEHMATFDAWLKTSQRSLLLPLWRIGGFMLGALPALIGSAAVFTTIDAVERFVMSHYRSQISRLHGSEQWRDVHALLRSFYEDEARHQDDALRRYPMQRRKRMAALWSSAVSLGSRISVVLAKRF
ncbi:MAG: demethoxyubiquinone hydroxylase family protein [Proteobacteria bacterium]|nr:demethoxyubiquinone hydroxylase family protein [Pseudomonadota bacterium]